MLIVVHHKTARCARRLELHLPASPLVDLLRLSKGAPRGANSVLLNTLGEPMSRRAYSQRCKTATQRCLGQAMTPVDGRHAMATWVWEKGAPLAVKERLSRSMGHSVETQRTVYAEGHNSYEEFRSLSLSLMTRSESPEQLWMHVQDMSVCSGMEEEAPEEGHGMVDDRAWLQEILRETSDGSEEPAAQEEEDQLGFLAPTFNGRRRRQGRPPTHRQIPGREDARVPRAVALGMSGAERRAHFMYIYGTPPRSGRADWLLRKITRP